MNPPVLATDVIVLQNITINGIYPFFDSRGLPRQYYSYFEGYRHELMELIVPNRRQIIFIDDSIGKDAATLAREVKAKNSQILIFSLSFMDPQGPFDGKVSTFRHTPMEAYGIVVAMIKAFIEGTADEVLKQMAAL